MFLTLPTSFAQWALTSVMVVLNLPQEVQDFFNNKYSPEIIPLLAENSISIFESIDLFISFAGMLIKIGWAFLWQEQYSPPIIKGMYNHFGLMLARAVTPELNRLASYLDGIYNTEADVVFNTEIYPGARYCNAQSAHALWHQQSANGLFDLILVMDKLYGLL